MDEIDLQIKLYSNKHENDDLAKEIEESLLPRFIENSIKSLEESRRIISLDLTKDTTDELFKIFHSAKTHGKTFGYPLYSKIGNKACRFITEHEELTAEHKPSLRLFISIMYSILDKKIQLLNSDQLASLEEVIDLLTT